MPAEVDAGVTGTVPGAGPGRDRFARGLLLGCLLAALSGGMLAGTARSQFDWFDMSAFLDAGYRTWVGQEPYVDFFYLGQPLHLWLHALFFELFGFTQDAVLAHMQAFNAAAIVLFAAWAWCALAPGPAILTSAFFAISYYGPIAHPWYDQNATFFVLAGLVAVEFARMTGTGRAWAAFAAGSGSAAAFMVKANVGAVGGATLLAASAFGAVLPRISGTQGTGQGGPVGDSGSAGAHEPYPSIRRLLRDAIATRAAWTQGILPFAAGAALVAGACLAALESPGLFLYQAFVAYDSRTRLFDFEMLRRVVLLMPNIWIMLPALLFARLGGPAWRRRHAWELGMLVLLGLGGLAVGFTGSMVIPAKILFCAPLLLYVFRLAAQLPLERIARGLVESFVGLVGTFLVIYAGYSSLPPVAWLWRPSNADNTYALQATSFRGWRCNPATGIGVDAAVAWIDANVPPEDSLLVFPDCTVIYGMTGHQSPRGMPFLWHWKHIPPPGPLHEAVRARLAADPPRWILVHEQREVPFFETARMLEWMGLDRLIAERYAPAWEYGPFRIHRLRQG